jgi:fatty acyl-CoA reductase
VSEVSVVFHSAATVKFDEELTKSVAMNVGAVLSILNLCKKMPNLEVSSTVIKFHHGIR